MSEITRVALDAMGGDNAPGEIVKGAVEAVQRRDDIKILLTGKEEVLKKELSAYTYPKEQIEIVNATEVIETAEPPVKAIRGKKDSSIVVAMKMVKKGEADAFKDQFKDKNVDKFEYTKTGATADDQIDALSGATITTNAMTNGVNAGLCAFQYEKGGNQ